MKDEGRPSWGSAFPGGVLKIFHGVMSCLYNGRDARKVVQYEVEIVDVVLSA